MEESLPGTCWAPDFIPAPQKLKKKIKLNKTISFTIYTVDEHLLHTTFGTRHSGRWQKKSRQVTRNHILPGRKEQETEPKWGILGSRDTVFPPRKSKEAF